MSSFPKTTYQCRYCGASFVPVDWGEGLTYSLECSTCKKPTPWSPWGERHGRVIVCAKAVMCVSIGLFLVIWLRSYS